MPSSDGALGLRPRSRPSARAVGQVLTAVKNSKSDEGPTMTEIVRFISNALINPATKRQVLTALKRGVEFGLLKRIKGHYVIPEPEEKLEVPIEKVRGLKSKLDRVKKRRGPRRTKPPLYRRTMPDYQETPFEFRDLYRNLSYRSSAVSSTTTLDQSCRDCDSD